MNYQYIGVLDFEANCAEDIQLDVQEIIEFPVVPYNLTTQSIEEDKIFHYYCQVKHYPITDFCTQLTGITQAMVDKGKPFPDVIQLFRQWMQEHQFEHNMLFLTCGDWDFQKCLTRYCDYLNIAYPYQLKQWCNIKFLFREYYQRRAKGMKSMLHTLNLQLEGRHHSGIDDCRNIAKIVDKMVKDGYQIKVTSQLAS